jgi:hypothetical protein
MRAVVFLLTCAAFGCGGRAADPARFVPSALVAKQALTTALEAWKRGRPTGLMDDASPALHVVDESRPKDQRLLNFEILGEIPGKGPRTFNVRLETENPSSRETVRYIVVGIDPLWVFRQFDYDKMAHWEMDMKHDDEPKEKSVKAADRKP